MLTNAQFERARRLAVSLAGIELAERHHELLDRRTRRLGILDSASLNLLLDAAEQGDATARQRLLGLLTTKFTGFFRHPRHFEIAARHARSVSHGRQARLWSAAAATGEEPYSLAMALVEMFGCDDPPASILATDLDAEAVAVGQRGEYGEAALRGLEPARRQRFLRAADAARRWRIAPALRQLIAFRTLNLVREAWPLEGPFDVIFCRNVLMYLESRYRRAVLAHMASLLAPDGLLMIDPTEHLGEAAHLFIPESEAVYRPSGRALFAPAPAVKL